MTNPSIITDEHKTQQTAKVPSEFGASDFHGFGSSGPVFTPDISKDAYGLSLGSRNSFSTPNLQSMHVAHRHNYSHSQTQVPKPGDQSQAGFTYPASRNGSRPASPSTLIGPQSKRRKGSTNGLGRTRAELTMTHITPPNVMNPPMVGGQPSGPSRPTSLGTKQPFSPTFNPVYGLSTPPTSSHMGSTPATPNPQNPAFCPRSHSVEGLPRFEKGF